MTLSVIGSDRLPAERGQNPIRRRKLYEEVALRIEAMIRDRGYAPGDRLPSEKEIMVELGVGRSAVREAMLSLQKAPTAQVLVNELSGAARLLLAQDGGIQQFQEARALFEIGLVRLAAQQATPKHIEELRRVLEANGRSIGNQTEFMRTDVDFHYAIASIPGNTIFTSMYNAVVEWLTEQREISGRAPEAGTNAFAAHTRIFQAIAGHNPAEAQIAMQEHLDQVVKFYWAEKNSSPG
jgi:DNA-binding FadR family transcriptional regulator